MNEWVTVLLVLLVNWLPRLFLYPLCYSTCSNFHSSIWLQNNQKWNTILNYLRVQKKRAAQHCVRHLGLPTALSCAFCPLLLFRDWGGWGLHRKILFERKKHKFLFYITINELIVRILISFFSVFGFISLWGLYVYGSGFTLYEPQDPK